MLSLRLLFVIYCLGRIISFTTFGQRIIDILIVFSGSIEASTFFGVVFGFLALGLVLFLYINRKWCFNTSNRNWCEENVYPTAKYAQKIGMLNVYLIFYKQITTTVHFQHGRDNMTTQVQTLMKTFFVNCVWNMHAIYKRDTSSTVMV